MVEQSQANGQVQIILGNPSTTRGMRCPIIMTRKADFLVYATKDVLNFHHIEQPHLKSAVYTEHRVQITSICQHPVDDSKFAFGNAAGLVTILIVKDGGAEFVVDKEFGMVSSMVRDICFTDDGERIIAVGEG